MPGIKDTLSDEVGKNWNKKPLLSAYHIQNIVLDAGGRKQIKNIQLLLISKTPL